MNSPTGLTSCSCTFTHNPTTNSWHAPACTTPGMKNPAAPTAPGGDPIEMACVPDTGGGGGEAHVVGGGVDPNNVDALVGQAMTAIDRLKKLVDDGGENAAAAHEALGMLSETLH